MLLSAHNSQMYQKLFGNGGDPGKHSIKASFLWEMKWHLVSPNTKAKWCLAEREEQASVPLDGGLFLDGSSSASNSGSSPALRSSWRLSDSERNVQGTQVHMICIYK